MGSLGVPMAWSTPLSHCVPISQCPPPMSWITPYPTASPGHDPLLPPHPSVPPPVPVPPQSHCTAPSPTAPHNPAHLPHPPIPTLGPAVAPHPGAVGRGLWGGGQGGHPLPKYRAGGVPYLHNVPLSHLPTGGDADVIPVQFHHGCRERWGAECYQPPQTAGTPRGEHSLTIKLSLADPHDDDGHGELGCLEGGNSENIWGDTASGHPWIRGVPWGAVGSPPSGSTPPLVPPRCCVPRGGCAAWARLCAWCSGP